MFGASAAYGQRDLTPLVNPFVGTANHGHTYPGATVPFGMVQLSPDTRVEGWDACAGYYYSDSSILGFSHTHLSGTGVADYGDVLLMPTVGPVRIQRGDPSHGVPGYQSTFRHSGESASPGYYAVRLDDYGIRVELTATRHAGIHRYTFPHSDSANVIIDLVHGLGPDRVLESKLQVVGDREIVGFRRSEGWAKNQIVYFAAQFSKAFRSFGLANEELVREGRRVASGKSLKGFVRFKTQRDEKIVVKVGLSTVSIAGARRNLQAEMPSWDFDEAKAAARKSWNGELNKIWVDGGTLEQRRTFYTALYHSMLAPDVLSDVDGQYRGMDGNVHKSKDFEMYTVFSLWDTFRAEHPLFTIIDRKRTLDFVRSLLQKYEESGLLPVWELASNETWCMIGYHSVPVILDAYVKGIRGFDAQAALIAMRHSAELDHFGLKAYRENGFIPSEAESESVSKTLEYSYDDWCIAQFASAVGNKRIASEFGERAQYYRNLFDPTTGFMRARENDRWFEPFDPASVNFNYTEANAWQYSFFVPHDIAGLIQLCGGKEKFSEKLGQLFSTSQSLSGRNQADITGMVGQYAQGNEPSHHAAYLFDYAGYPWRTQEMVRRIVDSLYNADPGGLCGNDDCGQMSAWYVFSAMGFYPVTPGLPYYAIGSPLFDRVRIHLEGGLTFEIRAQGNSSRNLYIQSARLNGAGYDRTYLKQEDIMRGGKIEFKMGPEPGKSWGRRDDDSPPSAAALEIVAAPVLSASTNTFSDSVEVAISCPTDGATIHWALSNRESSLQYKKYERPIMLKETSDLSLYAGKEGSLSSKTIRSVFAKFVPPGKITLNTGYSLQYPAAGNDALIDGRRGNTDFRLGAWQGYEGDDVDAVVDLGSVRTVTRASLGCLQDINSWIFFPTSVTFSFSSDGSTFGRDYTVENTVSPKDESAQVREFSPDLNSVAARYVHVRAKNVGTCPPWHKAAGNKAWLFVDELSLNTK